MKKAPPFLRRMILVFLFAISFGILQSQTNVSVTTAITINSFPHTESNISSVNGGTASGMNGICNTLPCCSTLVYRVETPSYGSLRIENQDFQPLSGSIIAYSPDIDNPQDWSDLTYISQPGNFCGFRDTLSLGYKYNWHSNVWSTNLDPTDPSHVLPPGNYYILLWHYNNQAGIGPPSATFTFEFAAYCPDGYSCSNTSVNLCDGDGYLSPSGNLYTTSGSYQDTLFGAAYGGLDSLIFTTVTINHSALSEDIISNETLCQATDTLIQPANTDRVSFAEFDKSSDNWIECNNIVPSLINTNRSVFGWMKHPNQVSGSSQVLVGMNTSGTSTICNFLIGTNEQLGIYDGSNFRYSGQVVTDGLWHFVGYTYDEATDSTKIYVDGNLASKYKNSQSITSTTDRISLGQEFDGSSTSNFLDGLFTEVSFWDEVLDYDEISTIMNSAIENTHPKYSNLKAYYPMIVSCGADVQVVEDFSGNNNTGDASHPSIIKVDTLQQITGFNGASHFTVDWIVNGSSISTADTLELPTYSTGSYQMKLERDYFTITDDWNVAYGCAGSNTDLVITEIMYNPPESGSDSTEFIEIFNSGSGVVDMTGFSFTNGIVYTFPSNVVLNSGEYIVVAVDSVAIENTFGYSNAYQWTSGGLSNGGEPITLKDNTGAIIDTLRYDDVAPWPGSPDGDGSSLVLCDPTVNNEDGSNWIASGNSIGLVVNGHDLKGSPGAADSGCSPSGCMDTYATITTTECDSLVSPSTNYTWTTSGTYTDTIANMAGCDSIITVNLTINTCGSGVNITFQTRWGPNGGPESAGFDTLTFNYGIQNRLATVSLADLDGDNDVDFLSGNQEGKIFFYENSGTPSNPVWGLSSIPTLDTINIGVSQNINQIQPTLEDIDNDGDYDLFVGSRWDYQGLTKLDDIHFFENTGSTTNPVFTHSTLPGIENQNTGEFSGIDFADMDNDGDLDMIVGGSDSCTYFLNTGSVTNPVFVRQYGTDNPFIGMKGQNRPFLYVSPVMKDYDNDNDYDLYFGGDDGRFYYYENIGTPTSPDFGICPLNPFPAHIDTLDVGQFPRLDIADVTNDGIDDIVMTPFTPVEFYWYRGQIDGSGGCTDTYDTISPVVCVSYTSPSGNYNWTSTGSYMDTIPNAAGCDSIITINLTIANISTLATTMTVDSNVSCNGYMDGGATVNVTGGTNPYTYLWSNTAATASIAGVGADSYIVTVTDTDGCTINDTAIITEPVVLTSTMTIDSNVSVNGGSDGGATVVPSGGTTPYTYLWSNSATTASIAGVMAGTYSVTITDANGCSVNDTAIITEPTALASSMIIDSNVTCYSSFDGGATVVATGGTPPYTYLWSNSATTASIAGVGAGTYIVTVTDNSGGFINDTAIITEPIVLTSSMVVDSNVSCNGLADGGARVTPSGGTSPYTYLWSNSATTASIAGIMAGSYIVTITDANGCSIVDTAIITEPIVLTSTMVVDSNVSCNGLADGGATVTPSGGTSPYTYLWSNSATTASITGIIAGTYMVTITDANGCSVVDTALITEPVLITGTDVQTVCDSYTWIDGNTYTSNNNTAQFTVSAANGCDSIVTLNLTIQPSPTAAAGTDVTICEDASQTLSGIVTNELNILWTTAGDGIFDDATIPGATYTPGIGDIGSGSATLYLTAYSIAPCAANAVDTIVVNIQQLPIANAGSDDIVCQNEPYTLSGIASDQQNVMWTTTGDGTFDDASLLGAEYTPGSADISSGSVDLTLTSYAVAPCATDSSDTMTLSIQYLPLADAGNDDIVCETDSYTLSGIASYQQSVLWTTTGDGTFDDATILGATYTPGNADITTGSVDLSLTASAISPCIVDDVDVMTLTIQYTPSADAGMDATICETDNYTLAGIATNEQNILWTTAGDGSFDDATSVTAIYTPGTADITAGNVLLTLTSYAISPCLVEDSDDMLITIQYLPMADAGMDDILCETDSYTLSGVASYEQNILWTTAGDGSFDDASLLAATYTPGTGDIANGTVSLTMTAYAISPCVVDDSDNVTLTIQYVPQANAGMDDIICETDTYTLGGTAEHYQSLLWTTSGDGTFDDATILTATYSPGTGDIAAGMVDLTLTSYAISPCAVNESDNMTLSIQLLPIADAGEDATVCEVDTYTLSGVAYNEQSTLWTTSGDGTFDDPTSLTAIYTPGTNDKNNGSANLTLTTMAIAPCVVDHSDVMLLLVQVLPSSNAGIDGEVCEDDTYQMNGSATNEDHVYWATLGDGVFDDPFSLNAIYSPGENDIELGDVDLVLFAYSIAPCFGEIPDTMNLVVYHAASANAGDDDEICETENYTLSGEVMYHTGQIWTTSGDGTFDDPNYLSATYTPGNTDIENGMVNLTLKAFGNTNCPGDATDVITLIIHNSPDQPIIPMGPTAIDLDNVSVSEYSINNVENAIDYTWVLIPQEAGTISGIDTIGTVNWNQDYTGLIAEIYVIANADYCDPIQSESLDIGLSPVSIYNPETSDIEIVISPNPSDGKFKVNISGATEDIEVYVQSSSGQVIKKFNLLNTIGEIVETVDLRNYPAGNYYMNFVTSTRKVTKKVSVNKLFR